MTEKTIKETEASLSRKYKSSGQCAYEKYQELLRISRSPWEAVSLDEQEAWFHAAVEGWNKIQEENTDKRFMT